MNSTQFKMSIQFSFIRQLHQCHQNFVISYLVLFYATDKQAALKEHSAEQLILFHRETLQRENWE